MKEKQDVTISKTCLLTFPIGVRKLTNISLELPVVCKFSLIGRTLDWSGHTLVSEEIQSVDLGMLSGPKTDFRVKTMDWLRKNSTIFLVMNLNFWRLSLQSRIGTRTAL